MESRNSSPSLTFTDKIKVGLKIAQQEIEELALQFSLGKADASDKFEDIKKEFAFKTHEWKSDFSHLILAGIDKAVQLKTKFEELQLQLDLGRAEAKDHFEDQRKKILFAIQEIETDIKSNPELELHLAEFKSEVEKFKLKMDIMLLKFELKKFELKDDYKSEMADARLKIDNLFEGVEEKWGNAKKKYTDFGAEIEQAYTHLQKAVKTLSK